MIEVVGVVEVVDDGRDDAATVAIAEGSEELAATSSSMARISSRTSKNSRPPASCFVASRFFAPMISLTVLDGEWPEDKPGKLLPSLVGMKVPRVALLGVGLPPRAQSAQSGPPPR